MVTLTQCPCCGGKNFTEMFRCNDYTVSHETFSILKCATCTTLLTTPRPNDNDLHRYYLSDEYISHTNTAKSIVDKLYLFARKFTLKKKLRLIERLNHSTKIILDYGCGTGEFLQVCKANGWNIDGVEPSQIAREKAKTTLRVNLNDSIENSGKHYDVITLWHVLEHVSNPSDTLLKISNRLSTQGTIIVAVPNYKSYDAHHYKQFWAAFDVPRHLWHFSPAGMKALLQRNDLQLIATKPMKLDSFYVSLLSEKYKNGRLNIFGMLSAFTIGLLSNLTAITTGNYSSLIYIIRKK